MSEKPTGTPKQKNPLEKLLQAIQETSIPAVKLPTGEVVADPKKFVDSHEKVLKAHSGNKAYMPYYHRLQVYLKTVKEKQ